MLFDQSIQMYKKCEYRLLDCFWTIFGLGLGPSSRIAIITPKTRDVPILNTKPKTHKLSLKAYPKRLPRVGLTLGFPPEKGEYNDFLPE